MVERLPSLCEVWGSIPRIRQKEKIKRRDNAGKKDLQIQIQLKIGGRSIEVSLKIVFVERILHVSTVQ